MKTLSPVSFLLSCSLLFAVALMSGCSTDLATPTPLGLEDNKISYRTDFSGYEEQVKVKVAERDQIQVSDILTCYYCCETQEGYGRYHFTTNLGFGIYTVTGIIGDDVEGW